MQNAISAFSAQLDGISTRRTNETVNRPLLGGVWEVPCTNPFRDQDLLAQSLTDSC